MDDRVNKPLSKVDVDYFIEHEKQNKRYRKVYLETHIAHIAKLLVRVLGLEVSDEDRLELRDDLTIEQVVKFGINYSYPSDLCLFVKDHNRFVELERLNIEEPENYLCFMPPEFLFMEDEDIIKKVKENLKNAECI